MEIYIYPYPASILFASRTPGYASKSPVYFFDYGDPPQDNISGMILGFRGIRYPHKIAGTVTVDGQPAVKKVLAFNRATYELLGVTESAADGTWEIKGMPPTKEREVLVLALDDTGKYNAEVADFITAVGGIEPETAQPEEATAGG